ncbi:MAG: ABC transporter substrate-binding protein [Actinobacteria bacterium]|nr:MAG: ABC transporter substrate-binding protein [Actinomycetota bacterium]
MTRSQRWTWLLSVGALIAGFALLGAACGGKSKSASNKPSSSGGGKNQPFANFRIAYDTGTDYLDPGLSYTVEGWSIMWNVYLPLLGYKHVNGPDGATIVPYLAKAMPKISSDGKTYTLTLRKGLKYSDGTPVKASDFRATIERDYKVDSPGVGFFSNVVGADAFSKTKKGHITGITTNDKTGQITIKLTQPQGDFQNILATEFAALLPPATPAKDQSPHPAAATGPYMIQSYKANKLAVVVRNPQWKSNKATGISEVPNGNPDKMTIDILGDPGVALTRTLKGQDDYDFQQPPPDRLGTLQSKYSNQTKVYTPANTYYFFMNNRVKPFDDVRVRQAVNYAINRQALVRVYGGLANPTENVLPPTYPQYKKHNLYPYNLAKAKKLIAAAGVKGMSITVWNHDRGQDPKATEYLTSVLNSLGFKAKDKIINSSVYWTTIGNQTTKAQIGFADWFQDYPHPLDWFDVLLNGTRITPTHNNNYSNFDDKAVNAKIASLKKQTNLSSSVNAQWAALDKQAMQQAAWAPFINRQFVDTFNSDIDLGCYVNHVLYQFDFATICHK